MKNKTIKITEKELKEIIENKLNNNRKEYYVAWSSWFDNHQYDIDLISSIIENLGEVNVHVENQFGWSNQPEVVVFEADKDSYFINPKYFKKALQKALNSNWIEVLEKDWSSKNNNLDETITIDSETAERDPDLVKKLEDKIGDEDVIKITETHIRKLIEQNEKPKITKRKLLESLNNKH